MDSLAVYQHRGGLRRTRARLAAGRLVVGFIGGSITDGRPGHNWPEPVANWLVEQFPHARLVIENAAIGATGSDLAVFRAQRDLIDRGCDLVFVEFAVNDGGAPPVQRRRTREGLLRKLLAGDGRDLVLTYTYAQDHYAPIMAGQAPATIAEFEQLGAHYQLGSVWLGLHALREVCAGRLRYEEWLPDGLHPQQRGSLSYAQSVIAFLQRELRDAPSAATIPTGAARPAPLDPANWEGAAALPFTQVRTTGPWLLRRWPNLVWIDQVLETSAPRARLAFHFSGRALVLGFDFGRLASEFRYRLDGGEWRMSQRDRPAWCGPSGWYRTFIVGDELGAGPHEFELEVVHGLTPECTGTTCRLGLIGVVP